MLQSILEQESLEKTYITYSQLYKSVAPTFWDAIFPFLIYMYS
jgi:hypothetical protein